MSILGLAGDARVSALGRCASSRRSAAIARNAHAIAPKQVAARQVAAALTDYRWRQIAGLHRRCVQREAASDRVLRHGTSHATHRQGSRRCTTNCVPPMARLGPRTAIQRQSASDCGDDCGGSARRPLAGTWCDRARTRFACDQGSRIPPPSRILKKFQTDESAKTLRFFKRFQIRIFDFGVNLSCRRCRSHHYALLRDP